MVCAGCFPGVRLSLVRGPWEARWRGGGEMFDGMRSDLVPLSEYRLEEVVWGPEGRK